MWTKIDDCLPEEGSLVEIYCECLGPYGRYYGYLEYEECGAVKWIDLDIEEILGVSHWKYLFPAPNV